MSEPRATRLTAIALALLLAAAGSARADPTVAEESLLKAAFIYNFAKFTRWPDDTSSEPDAPMYLCTDGRDALVEALQALAGKRVRGHPLAVRPIGKMANPAECHLLYVARPGAAPTERLLAALGEEPVLTISELPAAGRTAAIIRLFREKDRIRFVIDLDAARMAGLELSARLLSLGVVVGGGGTP